jgi:hypothetical protein
MTLSLVISAIIESNNQGLEHLPTHQAGIRELGSCLADHRPALWGVLWRRVCVVYAVLCAVAVYVGGHVGCVVCVVYFGSHRPTKFLQFPYFGS